MLDIILASLISSSVVVAFIASSKDLVLWKLNRKAIKEDKTSNIVDELNELKSLIENHSQQIEKILDSIDKLVADVQDQAVTTKKSLRVIVSDRVQYLAMNKLKDGEITFEEKKNLIELWEIFHYTLGGNGNFDDIMELIRELPIKLK